MIFFLLNALLFVVVLGLSFSVDRKTVSEKNNTAIVNLIITLSVLFLLMALTIGLCLWGPKELSKLIAKVTFMFMGWYCVAASLYVAEFPKKKNKSKTIVSLIQVALDILALYMIFVIPDGFNAVTITSGGYFQIVSGKVIPAGIRYVTKFNITWFELYSFIFCFIIPGIASIMLLVKAEHEKSKLECQKMLLTAFGVAASWFLFLYINRAYIYQPMVRSLIMFCFLPEIAFFVLGFTVEEMWSRRGVVRAVARYSIRYALPALLGGLAFVYFWPLHNDYPSLFLIIFLFCSSVITLVWYYVDRFMQKRDLLRDNFYASAFEEDLSQINYDGESQSVTETTFELFKKYLDCSSMKIVINTEGDEWETVYSSDGSKLEVKPNSLVFDTLVGMNHPVVFREWASHSQAVSNIRAFMLEILNASNSDAFIMLNEGRQIIGMILLGKKNSGNIYSEYDYETFNKLYSNFFVIGYYVKNIMNEALIGTVNREIRMSDQIITSIQENMDVINNPKADVGYLMVPAHNIGGEFVDMIRLNNTRYIFIIGALSGKGIAASMSMVILKSIIRTFLTETTDFKQLVEKVNNFIRESLPKGTFFAGTFGLIDFSTDTLYYINCGAPALFLYTRAYNNVIEIQGAGRILGFVEDIGSLIKVRKVKLAEGDMLLACTDGIIESRSLRGEMFGKSRIQSTFMENAGYPASKMAQFTYDTLKHFLSTEVEDDITLFVVKYHGGT